MISRDQSGIHRECLSVPPFLKGGGIEHPFLRAHLLFCKRISFQILRPCLGLPTMLVPLGGISGGRQRYWVLLSWDTPKRTGSVSAKKDREMGGRKMRGGCDQGIGEENWKHREMGIISKRSGGDEGQSRFFCKLWTVDCGICSPAP